MKEKKTVKNKYGVDIVCCCASCLHNRGVSGNESTRVCDAGEGMVKPSSWCAQWKMRCLMSVPPKTGELNLDAAGKGGGMVKSAAYLKFALNYDQSVGIKQIRAEYERKYGSIYINNL